MEKIVDNMLEEIARTGLFTWEGKSYTVKSCVAATDGNITKVVITIAFPERITEIKISSIKII